MHASTLITVTKFPGVKEVKETSQKSKYDATEAVENALRELNQAVKRINLYKPKDGKDGRDGLDGEPGKDGSPDTPEEIARKLETIPSNKDYKKEVGKNTNYNQNRSNAYPTGKVQKSKTQIQSKVQKIRYHRSLYEYTQQAAF